MKNATSTDRDAAMLAKFAKQSGVVIVKVNAKDWGGPIGYREGKDSSHTVCGFRTENAAYRDWFESKLGKKTAAAIMALMRKASRGR